MSIYTITERAGTQVYDDAEVALAEWEKKQSTSSFFVLQGWRFDARYHEAIPTRSIESEEEAERFRRDVIVPARIKTLEAQVAELESELAVLKSQKVKQ
jgi:hypothetical protein